MSKHVQENDEAAVSGSPADVIFLLKKLQEQLTFLERKVDILVNQSKERPSFNRERTFSKPPFRSSSSSYGDERHGDRPDHRSERSGPPRERGYESGNRASSSERSYGDRDRRGSRGFAGKKKPFFSKNKER